MFRTFLDRPRCLSPALATEGAPSRDLGLARTTTCSCDLAPDWGCQLPARQAVVATPGGGHEPGLAVRDAAIEKNGAEMATRIASDA